MGGTYRIGILISYSYRLKAKERQMSPKHPELSFAEAAIISCLYRYIDRMNDICPIDPAEKILAEFVEDMNPLIIEHLRLLDLHRS